MADKKEVYDYLRNKQKAAEIESKTDGINLWVLLGAIAVVFWQLLGTFGGGLWSSPDLILRTLLCAEAIYLSGWGDGSARVGREEIRYSRVNPADLNSPFLFLLQGLLLLLPPIFSFLIIGKSWGAFICGLIGFCFFLMGGLAVTSRLFGSKKENERFPKPDFVTANRTIFLLDVIFAVAFILAIFEQGKFAWENQGQFTSEIVKQSALVGAFYILLIITIRRQVQNKSIAWTYELETELLLGYVPPEVAVRRIEHRALGPRLQDVMDRFFDDMDGDFEKLSLLFEKSSEKIASVRDVPEQYQAERAARLKEATKELSDQIEKMISDFKDFGAYVKKLEKVSLASKNKLLAPHLESLKTRQKKYEINLESAKRQMKGLQF
jgi:hypothetical protein